MQNQRATGICSTAERRIGLLGGSFNPAHAGHVHISLEAMKRIGLQEIWWLVSPQNPLKRPDDMADYATRLSHARRVAAPHACIRVTDFEQREGLFYTVDTLRRLKQLHPRAQFVWLMGADNLASFHRWRRWREILQLMPVAAFDRAPFSHRALRSLMALACAKNRLPEARARTLPRTPPPGFCVIFLPRHAGSATVLRKTLGKKAFLRDNESESSS